MLYRVRLVRGYDDITFDFDDPIQALLFAEYAVKSYSSCDDNEGKTFETTIFVVKTEEEVTHETSDGDSAGAEGSEEAV